MRRTLILFLLLGLLAACSPDQPTREARKPRSERRHEAKSDQPNEKKRPKAQPSLGDTPPDADVRPWWKRRVDDLLKRKPMSIQVRLEGEVIYSSGSSNDRVPASVQKLVLSMALFEEFGPHQRFPTRLAARTRSKNTIKGDLWVIGSGDPTVAGNPHFLSNMPSGATDIQRLVRALKKEGITTIEGNVMASMGPFERDWYAPGWKPYFPSSEVGLPSALTFNGNVNKGRYAKNPEKHLAESLLRRLRKAGITVTGGSGFGFAPKKLRPVTSVPSPPLEILARFMNRQSSNFFAEVLGKRLGGDRFGAPGTIAKGARAIKAYARRRGVMIDSFDSSGLSYENKMSTGELATLIEQAEEEPWVDALRRGLAAGGDGTLEDRLHNVRVRAKTGTLVDISALAGWVWSTKANEWAEFAIISRGLEKYQAVPLEDKIVRTIYKSAG
jgi:D-alanyl-D-alanine carboxypeptidase